MEHMMERTVTLGSKSGLHARPAAVFVQNAKGFQSQITLMHLPLTFSGLVCILSLQGRQEQCPFTTRLRGLKLAKNEKTANAKSILSVLSLGAEQGDQVVLKINGDDAEFAIDKLATLLEGDLG